MTTQAFPTVDIKGLTPAVEPAKSQEIFALDGRNFVFDSKGPKSYFGNRLLLAEPFQRPEQVQSIRLKLNIGDIVFHFTADGVFQFDQATKSMRIIYGDFNTAGSEYRWTSAYLNRLVYFAHPSVGMLVYNPQTRLCVPAVTIGNAVPEGIIAVTENNGRIIAMTSENFHYSAQSNGLDYSPRLGIAGFQLISDQVSGTPIMVSSYENGCLTWTSGGVMRSEFRGDSAVYRHKGISTQYRPINSFCLARVNDDQVVILDERGLFQSAGDSVEPYNPVFNEFFIQYVKDNRLDLANYARLEWDEFDKLLYLSISLSQYGELYDFAFVLYPDLDKWGFFDEEHYGITPIEIDSGSREGSYHGYVDASGFQRYFLPQASREQAITEAQDYDISDFHGGFVQPELNIDLEASATLASTMSEITTVVESTRPNGYYLGDALTEITPLLEGLNSRLVIGFYDLSPEGSVDDLTEITAIQLMSPVEDNTGQGFSGFNLDPGVGDPLPSDVGTVIPKEFNDQSYVNFGLRVLSTIDGSNSFNTADPDLVSYDKNVRFFACHTVGLLHALEFTADEIGDTFHPSVVSLTAVYAGKLQ